MLIFRRRRPSGGIVYREYEKIAIFDQYLAISQSHDIIQRQITRKWYKIELYLQWQTDSRSYMISEWRRFQRPWTAPNPQFQGHALDAEYLRNGNTNRDLHTPYSSVSFRMTSSDLEWLSEIFKDMKHRAVSLRRFSFLLFLIVYFVQNRFIFCVLPRAGNTITRACTVMLKSADVIGSVDVGWSRTVDCCFALMHCNIVRRVDIWQEKKPINNLLIAEVLWIMRLLRGLDRRWILTTDT